MEALEAGSTPHVLAYSTSNKTVEPREDPACTKVWPDPDCLAGKGCIEPCEGVLNEAEKQEWEETKKLIEELKAGKYRNPVPDPSTETQKPGEDIVILEADEDGVLRPAAADSNIDITKSTSEGPDYVFKKNGGSDKSTKPVDESEKATPAFLGDDESRINPSAVPYLTVNHPGAANLTWEDFFAKMAISERADVEHAIENLKQDSQAFGNPLHWAKPPSSKSHSNSNRSSTAPTASEPTADPQSSSLSPRADRDKGQEWVDWNNARSPSDHDAIEAAAIRLTHTEPWKLQREAHGRKVLKPKCDEMGTHTGNEEMDDICSRLMLNLRRREEAGGLVSDLEGSDGDEYPKNITLPTGIREWITRLVRSEEDAQDFSEEIWKSYWSGRPFRGLKVNALERPEGDECLKEVTLPIGILSSKWMTRLVGSEEEERNFAKEIWSKYFWHPLIARDVDENRSRLKIGPLWRRNGLVGRLGRLLAQWKASDLRLSRLGMGMNIRKRSRFRLGRMSQSRVGSTRSKKLLNSSSKSQ